MSLGKARKKLLTVLDSLVQTQHKMGKQTVANEDDVREYVSQMDSHTLLALFLLMERKKGPDSYWKPYIDLLPTTYSNMPVLFDDSKLLELLKGSYGLEFAQKRKKTLIKDYHEWMDWCCMHFPNHDSFSSSSSFSSNSTQVSPAEPEQESLCANELFCTLDDFIWVKYKL